VDDKTIINTEPRGSNETQHNITNIVDPSAEKEKLHKGFPHLLKGSFLLEKYEVVGTFADLSSKNVSLYKCENRGNVYIAKIYHWKESISFDMINRIMGLRSPYIAEVVAIGEYEGYPCEIIRYYSGVDLHEKRLTLNQMVQIIYQLNEGLRTLHSNNIIHGDIKPGNIVISGFDNSDSELIEAKIIDFGICQFVPNAQTKLYALGHTPGYDAPELHNDYAFAADYYSLGVSILSFMIGGNPFEEMKHAERVTLLKELFSRYQLAPEFKELLDGLIANNPRDRWTYNKIASWCGNNGIIKISELASKRDEKFRYGYKGTNRQFALENMPVVDPECLHYSLFCVVENLLTRGEPTPLSMFLKNLFNKEIINDGDIDYIFSFRFRDRHFSKTNIFSEL
jgi:serine/threonine protein kinase